MYMGFSEDPAVINELVRCEGAAGGGSCCSTPSFMYQSCFDKTSKKLFIRSRIEDQRGRMWATKTK
jgi:hypothetical protein